MEILSDRQQKSQNGYILITVLVMLVVVSLGAGLVIMFSGSTRQMAEQNLALRAVNLAEAGFRYAAGEYKSAGSLSAKFDRLESLHAETVTLLNNEGSFQLGVHSYWFITNSNYPAGRTSLSVRVPGKFPDGFQSALPSTGIVKINNDFYRFTAISVSLGTGFNSDQAVISLQTGIKEVISRNTSVQLAFSPPGTQVVSEGSSLTVSSGNDLADLFPHKNGLIQIFTDEGIDAGTYRYRERRQGSIILSGISTYKDGQLPLTITSTSRIVVKKQAKVESVGSLGGGTVAASKGLSLNVFLSDEELIPADTPEELDLSPGVAGPQETFSDEQSGRTRLLNWEFNENDGVSESRRKTVTTQAIQTDYGISTNYLTFQNFSQVETDKGYTAEVIDKAKLPAAVRNVNFNGIWGNASDNIYFIGDNGTIVHFDGQTYSLETANTTQNLNAIWGLPSSKTDPNDRDRIFVVGNNGMALINEDNGRGWVRARHRETFDLFAAWGISWGHFDAYGEAGSNPYNWDSPNTADQLSNYSYYINTYGGNVNFRSLWSTDHSYRYDRNRYQNLIVGDFTGGANNGNGIILHEFHTPAVILTNTPLRGIWGVWRADFSEIYAVGDNGSIYRTRDANAPDYRRGRVRWADSWQGKWQKIAPASVPTTQNLNGVFGNDENDFYVVGNNGTILYNKGAGFELVPTADVTTENLNSIWGSDRTGIYAVGDNGTIVFLGYPVNQIGGHILPLSKNSELSTKWASTGKYLSYTIQTKLLWGDLLKYAASGICFRWHQPVSGKYAGYGVSFMRYDPWNDAAGYNDLIPDAIKPDFRAVLPKNDRLLIVLWEQYLQGGAEQRRWIAYKDITDDSRMVRADGSPKDHVTLTVRVHEKTVEGVKLNDIDVYYGNASLSNQGWDRIYNNTVRNEYNATFGTGADVIKWPVFDLDDWTRCPNPPDNVICEDADSFTLVDNVSVGSAPTPPAAGQNFWIINPLADLTVLKNNYTIRSSRFTSPSGANFGSQSDRSEIGLHVYGDIGDSTSQNRVSFTDFAVQLGVDTDASSTQSGFGNLQ